MTESKRQEDLKHLAVTSQFAIDMLSLNSVKEVWWHLAKNVVAELGFIDVVIYEYDKKTLNLVNLLFKS